MHGLTEKMPRGKKSKGWSKITVSPGDFGMPFARGKWKFNVAHKVDQLASVDQDADANFFAGVSEHDSIHNVRKYRVPD